MRDVAPQFDVEAGLVVPAPYGVVIHSFGPCTSVTPVRPMAATLDDRKT